MDSAIILAPNYRFTITDTETAARVFLTHKGYKETKKRVDVIIESMLSNAFPFAREMAQAIREYEGKLSSNFRIQEAHNKVPAVLRNEFAKLIAGTTVTPTFKSNYVALGNGSTAPADLDTVLDNETKRGLWTMRTATNNVAYLDKFFTQAEVGGMTFLEAGAFVDGTASVDTGYLLSRVLVDLSLSATETLSINATFTLNSAT